MSLASPGASPLSPRLVKGAIVALDPFNPLASVIIFQYNPAELTRTLSPVVSKEGESPAGTLRLTAPPRQTISIRVTINAADQLAVANPQGSASIRSLRRSKCSCTRKARS
jgi:hypothetical protein